MKVLDVPISEINKILGRGRVYCWGAGDALGPFLEQYNKFQDLNKVNAIVDTYAKGERTILSRVWPIIGVDEFLERISSDDLLIITTKFYEEIIELLREKDNDNKIKACVYIYTLKSELDKRRDMVPIPDLLRNANHMLIPKTIHYCWFGNNKMPDQYKKWIHTWKKYCPDYEIKIWNESNYDVKKIQYTKEAYESGKWAFVSDYARLDIIYNYGGIYLDTDVELLANIDELLYNQSFCGFETSEYVAFGLGFGSVRKNHILKSMMEVYENMTFINKDGSFNQTTCPIIQTKVLEEKGLLRNGEYQIVEGMMVLPERVLCPLSVWTRKNTKDMSKSYMYHHFEGTWDEVSLEGVNRIKKFYETIVDYSE